MVAANSSLQEAVLGSRFVLFVLLGAQLGLVFLISATIDKLAPAVAVGLFFLYSAVAGSTLSVVFVVYDLGTVGLAFASAGSIFAGLSVFGLTTNKDLTRMGPLLMAALLGLIVAIVANMLL